MTLFTSIMTKMKFLIIPLSVIVISTSNVSAYDIPSSACYIHANDSRLGEVYIYVPCNESSKFSYYQDNQLVLVSSSSVTGYLNITDDYTVNFRPYYLGRYRTSSSNSYINLNFTKIYDDTNVNLFTDSDQYISKYKNIILISSLVFLGGVLCLIYMKR